MKLIPLFTNRPGGGDYTVNFFTWNSQGVKSAQLACPFFTNTEPIKILKQAGCKQIQLLVRMCEVTSPNSLDEARHIEGVDVRFFTSRAFHAKFYILEHIALIGSANLTGGGLTSNRELSIIIDSGHEAFDDLPTLFDELWDAASVLTDHALEQFKKWHRTNRPQKSPPILGVEESSPPTINVKTQKTSRTRTYLETFRAFYVETLIPAYRIVEEVYAEQRARHPSFLNHSRLYEIDRFLYWVRGFTTDEELEQHPILNGDDLRANIRSHVTKWFEIRDEDLTIDSDRLRRISDLQKLFADEQALATIDIDSLADMLQGSAAFVEMLRFTKGGLDNHIAAFKNDNDLDKVRTAFQHLAFGPGDYVQRIYDSIYSPEFKVAHWGRNCTLELFGWVNKEGVPPFNGRIIKALRYLGFDVRG